MKTNLNHEIASVLTDYKNGRISLQTATQAIKDLSPAKGGSDFESWGVDKTEWLKALASHKIAF